MSEGTTFEGTRRPGETLRASAVSRSYQGVQALLDVTLELAREEVVGLIGPNGAGKSTLVNVVSGFDRPTSGSVELGGRDVTGWSPQRRGRHGLARTFQHGHAFRSLTVRENVEVSALAVGAGPRVARSRARQLVERVGLAAHADRPSSALAQGDERRLGLARALATEPRFMLLDEPAAGLPEAEIDAFGSIVRAIRDEDGAGVLLIDHNMALIMAICDRIHVLDQGRMLAHGTPAEIRGNLDVAAAYLGESAIHEAEP
ncbi:MAG TPA: ABC transporter ATP-binding protein [Gaiellaceae bacterium]|nr:ABC transporter ATP-binding protein [Gaiellaceae bacterium]